MWKSLLWSLMEYPPPTHTREALNGTMDCVHYAGQKRFSLLLICAVSHLLEADVECVSVWIWDMRMFAGWRCVLQTETCLCQQFFVSYTVVARTLTLTPSHPNQLPPALPPVVLLAVGCTDSLWHTAGLLLVNVNNEILRMTCSFCSVLQ